MARIDQVDWTNVNFTVKPSKNYPSKKVGWCNFHFRFVDPADKKCKRHACLSVPTHILSDPDTKICTNLSLLKKQTANDPALQKKCLKEFNEACKNISLNIDDDSLKHCYVLEIDPSSNIYNSKKPTFYKDEKDILKCISAWNQYMHDGTITDVNGKTIASTQKAIAGKNNKRIRKSSIPAPILDGIDENASVKDAPDFR